MDRDLRQEYFDWLVNIACGIRFSQRISYGKLLAHLHSIPFRHILSMDRDRGEKGKNLRYRFALVSNYSDSIEEILAILDGPCSVFEMILALAIGCEEGIMDDPEMGDRTGQWFWGMIVNLGLGPMVDDKYDAQYVDEVIDIFLDRRYAPNGEGGLFTLRHCDVDLREVEIWHQLCWYLDELF